MTTLTPTEVTTLRQRPQKVDRYLCVWSRQVVYTATVSGYALDPLTRGIYAMTMTDATGTAGDVQPGMTVAVGTTPGAADVGRVRVRETILAGNLLRIAETGYGDLPVEAGHYITVIDELRLWQKLPLLRGGSSVNGVITSFTEYKDYNIVFDDQTGSGSPPVANADYKPAGWCEPGQTYRLVTLDAARSWVTAYGIASSLTVTWTLPSGVTFES
ncbi:MAG TPA: hypothetical protein PKD09_17905, partial [Aggregatilinea sp.]|uniref:hypothetical protein n=1 Tax=Aggregatilinea sp. TaxID=2806333 RepID=UPI002C508F93